MLDFQRLQTIRYIDDKQVFFGTESIVLNYCGV